MNAGFFQDSSRCIIHLLLFPIRYRGYRNSTNAESAERHFIFLFISKVIHIIMFVVYFSQECDFTHNNRSDILYDSLLKYHIKLYSFIHWILKVKKSKHFYRDFSDFWHPTGDVQKYNSCWIARTNAAMAKPFKYEHSKIQIFHRFSNHKNIMLKIFCRLNLEGWSVHIWNIHKGFAIY